ncbi:MAG: ABC transporter permease [Myxococcota bacterium]
MASFDLDAWMEIGSTLRRNALRTTLTAVGVFWGVFLLIVMVGFGNGLEVGIQKNIGRMTTNSLFLWGQRTSAPFRGQVPGRPIYLTLEDAQALADIDGVELIAPRINLGNRRSTHPVTRGDRLGSFEIYGDTPDWNRIYPVDITGRFINPLDMAERRKVAVIGARVVALLFGPEEDPIGAAINIEGSDYTVVGTFETDATGDTGERDAQMIHVPLSTFQKTLSENRFVDYFAVLSRDDTPAGTVEARALEQLRERHRIAPSDKQALGSFNADAEVRKVVALFTGISVLILIVGGATLVAGLVGVSNIMMVSVRERTREIGIRKAIGATPRTVVTQVVAEAVVLASAAGYLGLVVGVGVLEGVGVLMAQAAPAAPGEASMFAPPFVRLQTALIAAGAVALGGGLAGWFPALHAARIRTVTALRDT